MKRATILITILVLAAAAFGTWWYLTDVLPERNAKDNTITPPAQEEEAPPTTTGTGETVEISVSGTSYSFNPSTITVPRDTKVRLTYTNVGDDAHDFAIPAFNVATPLVAPGGSYTVEFTVPSTPGSVEYVCTVLGHRDLGMRGTLVIE